LPVVNPEPFPRTGPFNEVVTAKVPDVVTGEPATLKPDGIVSATLVTVPAPPPPTATPFTYKPVALIVPAP
jgi:hypothetical protein